MTYSIYDFFGIEKPNFNYTADIVEYRKQYYEDNPDNAPANQVINEED